MKTYSSFLFLAAWLYESRTSIAFTSILFRQNALYVPLERFATATTNSISSTVLKASEEASICIIGGGVSGLSAALTAAQEYKTKNVVLLESSETLGGRVRSDKDENGFILDRGFAVFIEEYPFAKKLLNYDDLRLHKFLPGALVKLSGSEKLERVADPLRIPGDLVTALLAPVGTLLDKIRILPLIFHVRTKSIEELFEEPETDTLSSLKFRWQFSDEMIEKFFQPFLEGIYLGPLNEQSSRMFLFVFKMFSEGAATLPEGGIGAVAQQLVSKATKAGVTICTDTTVNEILENDNNMFALKSSNGTHIVDAKAVIVATEGPVSKHLLSKIKSLEKLMSEDDQPQRAVGCLYYSFQGAAPVDDPILILNGSNLKRGTKSNPINNICFPSTVSASYAPLGYNLCSVTVLKSAMDAYNGEDAELDKAVRTQLSEWFPELEYDIMNSWKLLRIYRIANAQPSQLYGPAPANVNHGRNSNIFRGYQLPKGVFVCGDHVATATLNGALASGIQAGREAATYVQS